MNNSQFFFFFFILTHFRFSDKKVSFSSKLSYNNFSRAVFDAK